MRFILLTSILNISFFLLTAQEIRIINNATSEPIANAAIYNQDRSKSILSNEQGIASLKPFSEKDSLFFQHTSFLPFACTFDEALNAQTIKLTRKVVFVPEYVISASKLEETQRETAHLVDVISSKKLELLT